MTIRTNTATEARRHTTQADHLETTLRTHNQKLTTDRTTRLPTPMTDNQLRLPDEEVHLHAPPDLTRTTEIEDVDPLNVPQIHSLTNVTSLAQYDKTHGHKQDATNHTPTQDAPSPTNQHLQVKLV